MLCRQQEAGCKSTWYSRHTCAVEFIAAACCMSASDINCPRSLTWRVTFMFPRSEPCRHLSFSPVHATCPAHPYPYHLNNIWWRLDVMNHGIKQLSREPCNFFLFRSRYLLQHPFSTTLSVWSSLKFKHQESQPCIQQENYTLLNLSLYTSLRKRGSPF